LPLPMPDPTPLMPMDLPPAPDVLPRFTTGQKIAVGLAGVGLGLLLARRSR
jgi:hypothetical protein